MQKYQIFLSVIINDINMHQFKEMMLRCTSVLQNDVSYSSVDKTDFNFILFLINGAKLIFNSKLILIKLYNFKI